MKKNEKKRWKEGKEDEKKEVEEWDRRMDGMDDGGVKERDEVVRWNATNNGAVERGLKGEMWGLKGGGC